MKSAAKMHEIIPQKTNQRHLLQNNEEMQKASVVFKPPLTNDESSICAKIKEAWEQTTLVAQGKASKRMGDTTVSKLDKSFDILNCKSIITPCSNFHCSTECQVNVYMQYTCPKNAKNFDKGITLDLLSTAKGWNYQQFLNRKSRISEHKRLQRKEHRGQQELEKEKQQAYREKRPVLETPMDFEDSSSEANSSVESECEQIQLQSSSAPKRNTEDISNIALAAIKYEVGLRATAAIVTAAWIDAGIIAKNETRLAIDYNKVSRAQEKIKQSAIQKFKAVTPSSKIECIIRDKLMFRL